MSDAFFEQVCDFGRRLEPIGGALACSRRMIHSSHSGISGLISRIGRGSSSLIRRRIPNGVSARNGARPVHIAYITLPRLNRSLRPSIASPRACSGDIYCGVPAITPLRVSGVVHRAGQSEIRVYERHALDFLFEQNVRRFHVAVDQPLSACGSQSGWVNTWRAILKIAARGSGPSRSIRFCSETPAM